MHSIGGVGGVVRRRPLDEVEAGTQLRMPELFEGLDAQLPHYAQPQFVRLLSSPEAIECTPTFKPKKGQLQAEGIETPVVTGGGTGTFLLEVE